MPMNLKQRNRLRTRRALRTRANIFGTLERPRIAFFRSNKNNYAQVIDDTLGRTLVSVSGASGSKKGKSFKKIDRAAALGELLAEKMKEANVKRGVFDRRSYKYHGRVRAFVEGLRKGGVEV